MTDEQKTINWAEEAQKIEEQKEQEFDTDWWRPSEGKYKVKFLSNGSEYEKEYDGKPRKKVRFDIEVNGKKYSWGCAISGKKKSVYYKISLVGRAKGKLKDEILTFVISGEGRDREYVITEAYEYMPVKEESVKDTFQKS